MGAGQIGFHETGWVGQKNLFPGAQPDLPFNQPAHDANVLGPADRVATDQYVVLELQTQMSPCGLVGQFNMFATRYALPFAKARRNHAQGVENVDLSDALELGSTRLTTRKSHHVEGRHARLFSSIGLDRADDCLA